MNAKATRSCLGLARAAALFLSLFFAGCFDEAPFVTTSTSTSGSTTGPTSASETSTSVAMGTGSSDTSTSTETTSTPGNPSRCATPVEIPVGGPFEVGDMQTISLDFDDLPAAPGTSGELCITFTTDNPASARTITIDAQVLAFGPCGAPRPPGGECVAYLEPAGVVDVTIDNTTFGPGCQNGAMDDLVLHFGCGDEGGSSGG